MPKIGESTDRRDRIQFKRRHGMRIHGRSIFKLQEIQRDKERKARSMAPYLRNDPNERCSYCGDPSPCFLHLSST